MYFYNIFLKFAVMNDSKLDVVHKGKAVELNPGDGKLYDVLKKLPSPLPSMKLNRAQKKWWVWFGVELVSSKEVSQGDLIHIQKAAFWMDARCQAYKEINDRGYNGGLVQTFKNGANNISAHVSIVEKADKHLDEVSAHFGFSILDRGKLKVNNPVDDSQLSLFEQLQDALYN
ncbi:phage terminase small subunit [Cellulophaga phage phi39:1]|uniref:phage terminase small subunit n=1 Tax=Cellulophaga phage phi39:1 TaxID=1327993 RepID=UPI000351EFE6|nr:phage terminase small subunit [Cellulophaga phage phi39:1]AGO49119.1 phage terminase small subunit [Cellulophaga phage phi39:1]